MTDEVLYEEHGPVAHVVLNRPQRMNALTFAMYERVGEICRTVDTSGVIKAIVFSGAGKKAFAAGTEIAQFKKFSTPEDVLEYEASLDRILNDVEHCAVPTVAALTGVCTGGGAGLATACDIRVGDRRLRFGFPIARTLGNCLSMSNLNRLCDLMGRSRVREILLTARLIDAEEAHACGIVTEVLGDPDETVRRAFDIAELVSQHAPLSVRATKEGLYRLSMNGRDTDLSDVIVGTYLSDDFKEGVNAFLAKRKPNWKGR